MADDERQHAASEYRDKLVPIDNVPVWNKSKVVLDIFAWF